MGKRQRLAAAWWLTAAAGLAAVPAEAAVTFIGSGAIPGDAVDQSGLEGLLEDGVTPANRIGGLGSAIAYSGAHNIFYATPDRGPADGATSYVDRLYAVKLALRPISPHYGPGSYRVLPQVVTTTLLTNEAGVPYTGSAAAFDPSNSSDSLRLDPEGLRVDACGQNLYVSDEYGPFLYRFDRSSGRRDAVLRLPAGFGIDYPSAEAKTELAKNVFGRQSNRGMEGLAISPDGSKLYGLMQNALLQDGALDDEQERISTSARLIEVDLTSGAFREFLYPLDSAKLGTNEIVAINDHEFLVIERDGKKAASATVKRIYRIDIAGATDIRALPSLPSTGVPEGVVPVAKSLFIDLLDPAYGLAANIPEKIEGLAFGPDLAGGHHTLVITSDNDFQADQGSQFFVFGFDDADLPGFTPQAIASCR